MAQRGLSVQEQVGKCLVSECWLLIRQFKYSAMFKVAVALVCLVHHLHGWRVTSAGSIGRAPKIVPARALASSMMEYRLNNVVIPRPIEPLNDNVLVKVNRLAGDMSKGGLLLVAAEGDEKRSEGLVELAGPGKTDAKTGKLIPQPCNIGDMVLISKGAGEVVDWQGFMHVMVSADEVLGAFAEGELSVATFRPLHDFLVVEVGTEQQETSAGIILTDVVRAETDENFGKVIAAGPGLYSDGELVPTSIKEGESVIFPLELAEDIVLEQKTLKIVSAKDVLAKY